MSATLTLGSLFDGIGGFPLAGVRQGFTPVWASEIEPFPIRVTKIRFSQMTHVGDITKLKGTDLPPVDLVCGGSPCQDLSCAGKRAGLQGKRSGLFMEQVRVIREMRERDTAAGRTADAVRPRYMVWENVPGAFSCSGGEDFRAVLEETCRIVDDTISIPRPPDGAWLSAGAIMGNQFSVAWRVLDAQYWPHTPQRRRRIYLVADFGGFTAPEILFEQNRLFGNSEEGEEARQGTAARSTAGVGSPVGACMHADITAAFCAGASPTAGSIGYHEELSPTLKASESGSNMVPSILCLNDQGGSRINLSKNLSGTLRSQEHGHTPLVMGTPELYENHGLSDLSDKL